ncbi:B-cell linker protein isoform X2 [Drosophila kikkawai]|uniref:B-cell linker protein isoform X2 n=1 Tax=Drosophila kikkawai TaxID=30033 RepID=A0ABM4GL37_DROKI
MCCWCARVYWTVLHNLLLRMLDSLMELRLRSMVMCGCCAGYQRQAGEGEGDVAAVERVSSTDDDQRQQDYVIVDDDATYTEIEERHVETEQYYFTVDRATAERMLQGREDGSCLVRPFKAADQCIRYIVSIWASDQYYHLFVRQLDRRQRYAIGQRKSGERYFGSPSEIVEFYSEHPLLCTNKSVSQCIRLSPISYA